MDIKVTLDKKIEIYLDVTTVKDLEQYGVVYDIVYDTPFINCSFLNKGFSISLNREVSLNESIDDIFKEKIISVHILNEFGDFDISVDDLDLNMYNINDLKNKFGNNIKNRNTFLFSRKSKKVSIDYKTCAIFLNYHMNKLSEFNLEIKNVYKKKKR